ncbi:hypothetical protein ACFQOZ_11615 [Comamonas endophytica]|uniref:hypothetical protein n=1 Tax=Comamonas endophytica TaxID=2949090 RepID=UPI003623E0F5
MLPGDRWSMDLQADEHVEATLALRLAPALQAGATLALPRAGGMLHDRIHARAAMAWVGWELQPGWTLSAGWQHAGGRPAERPPVWSHAASPAPAWRCNGILAPAPRSHCVASLPTTSAPAAPITAPRRSLSP